jgi:hypothetical protein
MKRPTESEFETCERGATAEVHFKPANSIFLFARLREFDDIVKFCRLSPFTVRHVGPTRDFVDYTASADDVFAMARLVAMKSMRDRFHVLLRSRHTSAPQRSRA